MSDLADRVRDLEAKLAERDAKLAERDAVIAKLQARIEELEARLGQNSSNSSLPPSSDLVGTNPRRKKKKGGRKRGGQKGHPGRHRELLPPEQVDAFVDHFPRCCTGCGDALPEQPEDCPRRHQITDLPELRPHVEEHRLHAVHCGCGTLTRAELPVEVPRGRFGLRLLATVALLTGMYRLSKRQARRLLDEFFGVEISLGSVSTAESRVSEALREPHQGLHAHVQKQSALHADETSWREDRKGAWLWIACTTVVSFFLVQKRRTTACARRLLGTFKGVLVTDRYGAYAFFKGLRQVCWAHLKRTFQSLADRKEGSFAQRYGEALLEQTRQMFALWHRVRDGTLARSTFIKKMAPIRKEVERLLTEAASCGCVYTQRKTASILKYKKALWTFVRHEGVEPTNNQGERDIRHGVILRKLSFGTQSERGSRFIERILSTVGTLRKQQRAVLPFLINALTAKKIGTEAPSLLPDQAA